MFSSCFGSGRRRRSEEQEPLLPQYNHDTAIQRRLHQKLHTYQMLRALSKGFMPSNEQAIVSLRTLLAADLLNPDNSQLSDSGQALVHYTKQWIKQLIELLQHKNAGDQIQDFIWYLSKAKVSVDMEHVAERASKAKTKADTAAVAREVFRDTAFSLSEASREAGKRLEPSTEEQDSARQPGGDSHTPPSQHDLMDQAAEVSRVLSGTASTVVDEAESSITQKLGGPEKDTMIHRLKEAVLDLRRRKDYSDSVSTLSLLLRRYATVYSRMARDTLQAADQDVNWNPETDRGLTNFWGFLKSFGEAREWEELEKRAQAVMEHGREDPQFEELVSQLGDALQEMCMDPSFFDHAEQRFQELRAKSKQLSARSSLRDDIDELMTQLQRTFHSILRDKDVCAIMNTTRTIGRILSPKHQYTNPDLVGDALNVFVPLLIQSIHYIPIPRLEVSTPEVDLLLENLILEPGITVNNSSFFPYKLRVETLNDIEIRKARFRTTSAVKTLMRIRIDGLSIRGEEIGYWLRAHTGLLRLADEGIASFALDERGLDIQLDVEVGRDRLEKVLSLRGVRVRIHKLNWKLRRSKFSLLAWLFKPFLRPIIRKTIEAKIASAIGEALHFANRELLYARERLRATRIADPDDLKTFFKAVLARLTPPEDPDLYTRVGVSAPGYGVFEGVYAPGSIAKLWRDEAAQAPQRIRENERDGWRNSIFDVQAATPA
ncbi:81dd693c-13d1-4379-98e6-6f54f37e1b9a [Thermothielavioides terrestris]|uniref:81dd693c-13d1-4379-98e6-6f54f37e1b9a n=1 Tax=Thermothielavioides terrestris TaxID=2587410 RepID=A0A446BR23_9PEZI|nr:81dd693c-13d1-4379-98e6-6f54f37e1b9a [Thermothielavioides terrestris]